MGPLILYCVTVGAMFIAAAVFMILDSYRQRQAKRFAKVYNRAAHAQWTRFRQAHPEVDCCPPIAYSGLVARHALTPEGLAKLYDDEAYSARELKAHAARNLVAA